MHKEIDRSLHFIDLLANSGVKITCYTNRSAQDVLAKASGLALKVNPIPLIYPIASLKAAEDK